MTISQVTNTCRVAFVGAGAMADAHIAAFADVHGVELVGITSRTRTKAESLATRHSIEAVYDSIEQMYQQTHADLVVAAVPILAMASILEQLSVFPWAMLLEKPVGYNLSEAKQLCDAMADHPAPVMVALNRRTYSSTQTVLEDVEKQAGPRFIYVQDQQSMAAAEKIGHPKQVVENWMFANSIHLIDYISLFGRGKITTICPLMPWTPDNPGIVLGKVDFDSGDTAIYQGVWNGPGPWAVTLQLPNKRWELKPLEKATYQMAGERVLHAVDGHPWDTQCKAGLRLQAQRAVEATLGQPCQLATLQDALVSMQLTASLFGMTE